MKNLLFLFRNNNVRNRNTYACTSRISKAGLFDTVKNHRSFSRVINFKATSDDFTEIFLTYATHQRHCHHTLKNVGTFFINKVVIRCTLEKVSTSRFINIWEARWENFIEDNFTHCCN
ncbi:hypothetical protein D3C73_1000980 [compost metagenome]